MKDNMTKRNIPHSSQKGLYRAENEHDACGVGMIVCATAEPRWERTATVPE